MKHFEVTCTIAAPPDRVWTHLTDARALANGNLGVVRLDGTIAPGANLKVWSEANPGRGFAVRVAELSPPRRMVWQGGLPFGLFRGVREFTLTPQGSGTLFRMREEFSGPLAPLIGRSIPDLTPSFERFAQGLRALAEANSR